MIIYYIIFRVTKGVHSLVDRIRNAVSGAIYSDWLSSAGQFFNKAQTDITSVFSKSDEALYDSIAQTSSTLDW